jgi:hypothetical protein
VAATGCEFEGQSGRLSMGKASIEEQIGKVEWKTLSLIQEED